MKLVLERDRSSFAPGPHLFLSGISLTQPATPAKEPLKKTPSFFLDGPPARVMRALEFRKSLRVTEDYPVPEPSVGEALIKVLIAGICNTDIEITKGYMGFEGILGHEFVGMVERINGPDQDLVGKRVVGEINCGCGRCPYCLKGEENHCPGRSVLGIFNRNGCLADYTTLPVKNLLEVPEGIPNRAAVFAEPLAAAFEILQQAQVRPAHRVLVLGDGKLGLLISLTLSLTQAEVMLVGKHPEKLAIARSQNVKATILSDLKEERIYDIVVEATGTVSGFEQAMRLVRPRGTIVLKSTIASEKPLNLSQIVVDEIAVLGSRCGPFKPALNALQRRWIDVEPLISREFPFAQAREAFDLSRTKGIIKVLVNFEES
ncbi:MAG: alcohol dehydrogenase catalytic domain-containing protein [Thermodesulfobacteriota bacterium]